MIDKISKALTLSQTSAQCMLCFRHKKHYWITIKGQQASQKKNNLQTKFYIKLISNEKDNKIVIRLCPHNHSMCWEQFTYLVFYWELLREGILSSDNWYSIKWFYFWLKLWSFHRILLNLTLTEALIIAFSFVKLVLCN